MEMQQALMILKESSGKRQIKKSKVNYTNWSKIYIIRYNTGKLPEDYIKNLFVTIQKKTTAKNREEFRSISLLSHTSKILIRLIFQRIETKIEQTLSEDQFGFKKNDSTSWFCSVLLSLMIVLEKQYYH